MGVRVAQVERFGGPEVLVTAEAPDPVAGAGQVVIAVRAADVLFLETVVRRGGGGEYFPVQPPYVPGGAVAGLVTSAGHGVDPFWIGRRVLAATEGGYAEQALAAADELIQVPDGLDLREAVALFHDGRTALGLLETTGVKAGEWVLVTAAGGGLGILLVQLAHAAGARVIAAARGDQKLGLAKEQGAAVVVDYTEPSWAERVREATGGAGPDVVFDGAGGGIGVAAFAITASGGRFSAHGAPSGAFADIDLIEAQRRGVTVRGIEQAQFAPTEVKRLVERALSEAAAGRIRAVIGQTWPLERAADAHAAIEARAVAGKTLLVIEQSR